MPGDVVLEAPVVVNAGVAMLVDGLGQHGAVEILRALQLERRIGRIDRDRRWPLPPTMLIVAVPP